MRALPILLVTGCWTTTTPPQTPTTPAASKVDIAITEAGFGPVDGQSPATLANMRKLFAGYDVRPINEPGLEYHVYLGAEQLFFVVTNEDLSIFNVHATSGKIVTREHPWRVGQPFQDSAVLTQCECWGQNPTCFRRGEHVAVNFARECSGLTSGNRRALKALDGLTPQRVIWSPTAFGSDSPEVDGVDGTGPNDPPPPPGDDDDDDGN